MPANMSCPKKGMQERPPMGKCGMAPYLNSPAEVIGRAFVMEIRKIVD